MHILLSVLKIAGISAGVLLLLLIFLLLLLLFVPFQYQIDGKVPKAIPDDGHIEWKGAEVKIAIHFLTILFQVVWEYKEKELKGVFRVLGIPVAHMGEKKETEKPKEGMEESSGYYTKTDKKQTTYMKTETINDNEKFQTEDKQELKQIENKAVLENTQKRTEEKKNVPKEKVKSLLLLYQTIKDRFFHIHRVVIPNIFQAVINFPVWLTAMGKKIWKYFHGFRQIGGKIVQKRKQMLIIWNDQHVRNGITMLWQKGKIILSELKPRKIKGYIHFGLSNPADTGKVLGIFSIAYAFIGDTVKIEPNFEKPAFHGELEVHGRIPVFVLLRIVWKLYRDKEVRYSLKKIREIKVFEVQENKIK